MINTLLDPASYKVFKFREKSILYDLSTNIMCKIDDELTYNILELAGQYDIYKLCHQLAAEYDSIDHEKINRVIQPLLDAGFFASEPADWEKIKANKKRLLTHTPNRLQLCIAQSCNLACVYCYAEENGANAKEQLMSYDTAKQAIDYLVEASKSRNKLSIQFFGGEPLLNFALMKQIIEYTKTIYQKTEKSFGFSITTNATLLNEEVQDFLVENRITTMLSIDGNEEIHNRQRPFRDGSDSYQQVLGNALALKDKLMQRGQNPIIRANVINGSAKELSNIAEMFSDMGFRAIGIAPIINKPGTDAPFAVTDQEFDEMKAQMDDYIAAWVESKETGETLENSYIERQVHKKFKILEGNRLLGGIRCGVGRGTNTVDVAGNIYPCHRYPGMENFIIGNVYTGLDQEKLSAYYDSIINNMLENCTDCWMRYKCGGPCPWQVSTEGGHICPSDKLSCDERKYSFMQGAYLYVRLQETKPEELKNYLKSYKK